MEPESQSRVEQLVHEALELAEEQRSEFLERRCAGDKHLRAEIESLLAFEKDAHSFMEAPALQVAAEALAREDSPAQAPEKGSHQTLEGKTIAHYRVVSKVGSGGMGVVYKAEDTRLHRFVALKFLTENVSGDAQALARFQREAQAVSALNHPNICTLYDIGEVDGRAYIALEYLEGTALNRLIAGRPVELDTLLTLAIEIADGQHVHSNDLLDECGRRGLDHVETGFERARRMWGGAKVGSHEPREAPGLERVVYVGAGTGWHAVQES